MYSPTSTDATNVCVGAKASPGLKFFAPKDKCKAAVQELTATMFFF